MNPLPAKLPASAHVDMFCCDRLPPSELRPDLESKLPGWTTRGGSSAPPGVAQHHWRMHDHSALRIGQSAHRAFGNVRVLVERQLHPRAGDVLRPKRVRCRTT